MDVAGAGEYLIIERKGQDVATLSVSKSNEWVFQKEDDELSKETYY